MNAKMCPLLVALTVFAVPARSGAQESIRDLGGPGGHNAFLTHNQLDRWVFEGDKGETIIAHVVSREFDPILELARAGDKEDDKVLLEVDDPGNESRFAVRLPEKGKYKIRVHAYKYQGGGNYTLNVKRFMAQPLTVGKPLVGTFDRAGKSYHYFKAVKDQILIPELKGASGETWTILDHKGRELRGWAGTVHVEESPDDSAECSLIVSGPPDYRYDLLVREARLKELAEGKDLAGALQQGELDVLSFQGKPGDFRLVEVERKGQLQSRLIFAPLDKKSEQRLTPAGDRPEIQLLPVASRGGRLRYAAILGREGRYQLQLRAETAASYKSSMRDPSVPLGWGEEVGGNLPVGGAAFYRFQAKPGQLFQANLASQQFMPVLRLYDAHGSLVGQSGDDTGGLEGRLTHMVVKEGVYRLQVASLGDGGGGDFKHSLKETKLKDLAIGERGQGTVQPGATDFWAFAGKEGQTVFLSVRSAAFEPVVSVRSPDGVLLVADHQGNAATGSLIALKLPKTGRYTVWVAAQRGAGEFTVRLIDGD
jgi:hypothetical protein